MELEEARVLRRAVEEWDGCKANYFTLTIDVIQAMALLGTIQLALRHPKNCGPASTEMRVLAFQLQERLALLGPATRRLCEMGWQPEHDQE